MVQFCDLAAVHRTVLDRDPPRFHVLADDAVQLVTTLREDDEDDLPLAGVTEYLTDAFLLLASCPIPTQENAAGGGVVQNQNGHRREIGKAVQDLLVPVGETVIRESRVKAPSHRLGRDRLAESWWGVDEKKGRETRVNLEPEVPEELPEQGVPVRLEDGCGRWPFPLRLEALRVGEDALLQGALVADLTEVQTPRLPWNPPPRGN